MSFDFSPMQKLSNVQASSKTTSGGGGNTGYFKREQNEEENSLGFAREYPDDSFEKTEIIEENENENFWILIKGLFLELFEGIKNFFNSVLRK